MGKQTDSDMNFICPYCGEEQGDSWEYDIGEDGEEIDCQSCEKVFFAYTRRDITYYAEANNLVEDSNAK